MLARVVDAEVAAVDHPSGADLLLAPVAAAGRLMARQKLTVDDFDLVEIHEAFASTVLATLAAWESDEYCRSVGLKGAIGTLDRSRAQRRGFVAGNRTPLRRDRRPDRPHAGQTAPRTRTWQPRAHLGVRRRRARGRCHPGGGVMGALEKVFYSPAGQTVAKRAGLPPAPTLRRGRTWPSGPIVLAQLGEPTVAKEALISLGRAVQEPVIDTPGDTPPGYGSPIGAIVVDATEIRTIEGLEGIRAVLRPAVRALEASGRVIILARPSGGTWEARAVARALDGINRTVGKELRRGATSNLLYVDPVATTGDVAATLAFLLQGRSAFVDGQSWTIGAGGVADVSLEQPLADKVVVVTGAARGIGASISRILARDGATIVAVDMPAAGEALAGVANEVGGTALHLDITAADAGGQDRRPHRPTRQDALRHRPQRRDHQRQDAGQYGRGQVGLRP